MVVPILTYGAEIWGGVYRDRIESVHRSFCKFILKVPSQAPNAAVLGECGRSPICVTYMTKCIKVWFKILNMSDTRYPKVCYNLLYRLNNGGKTNWVADVELLLCTLGFGHVWLSQTVGDVEFS